MVIMPTVNNALPGKIDTQVVIIRIFYWKSLPGRFVRETSNSSMSDKSITLTFYHQMTTLHSEKQIVNRSGRSASGGY